MTDSVHSTAIAPLSIVHTEASNGWGGQELRILNEMAGMALRGHKVILLCPSSAPIYREAQRRQLPVAALPLGRKRIVGVLALWRWLRDHPVDILNTHSSTDSWLAALANLFLFKRATTLIRTRHVSVPVSNNGTTRWLYQYATKHIITTGESLREQLVSHNGYDPDTITSVPTGIDAEIFRPGDRAAARQQLQLPLHETIVGVVATLRSWKGHEFLLRACAQLGEQAPTVLVVGDGPQREKLAQIAQQLNFTHKVIFAGRQDDVLPWLHAMDIFVLPSYANEGVPQALLQAMLCGLPVISTHIGAIPEALTDGISGLVVAPKDVDSLARAIQRLLADPDLSKRLSAQAQRDIKTRFAFSSMLDKMEKVYIQALRPRR